MISETQDPGSRMKGQEVGNDAIGRSRIALAGYTVIPLWYGCNNKCVICMLAPVKGKLPAIDFDLFKKLVIGIASSGRCRRLILSGAEVTTFADLEDTSVRCRPWLVRNNTDTDERKKLAATPAYLRRLIEAGVNEFFISLHGPKEPTTPFPACPAPMNRRWRASHNLAGLSGQGADEHGPAPASIIPHLPAFFAV